MDLSTFRQLKPDLVVLDIGLHRQNGIDLLVGFITMYLASQLDEGLEVVSAVSGRVLAPTQARSDIDSSHAKAVVMRWPSPYACASRRLSLGRMVRLMPYGAGIQNRVSKTQNHPQSLALAKGPRPSP